MGHRGLPRPARGDSTPAGAPPGEGRSAGLRGRGRGPRRRAGRGGDDHLGDRGRAAGPRVGALLGRHAARPALRGPSAADAAGRRRRAARRRGAARGAGPPLAGEHPPLRRRQRARREGDGRPGAVPGRGLAAAALEPLSAARGRSRPLLRGAPARPARRRRDHRLADLVHRLRRARPGQGRGVAGAGPGQGPVLGAPRRADPEEVRPPDPRQPSATWPTCWREACWSSAPAGAAARATRCAGSPRRRAAGARPPPASGRQAGRPPAPPRGGARAGPERGAPGR